MAFRSMTNDQPALPASRSGVDRSALTCSGVGGIWVTVGLAQCQGTGGLAEGRSAPCLIVEHTGRYSPWG